MTDFKNKITRWLDAAPLLSVPQLGHQIGNTLILAPHPDDEALGCGGMIAYLRENEVPVWIVFMTSGEASHPNSVAFPSSKLARVREQEAQKSGEILGVDATHIVFFKAADGGLQELSSKNTERIVSTLADLIASQDISTIFLPWRRDVHPDHMATNDLGNKVVDMIKRPLQVFEYPIWLWHSEISENWPLNHEIEIFKLDIRPVFDQKKRAIFSHISQTSPIIDDDQEGFMLTPELLSPFLKDFEYYFVAPKKINDSLDGSYFEKLYSNNPDPWNFKGSDYELKKYQTINSFMGSQHYASGLELGCSIGIQTQFLAKHCDRLLAVDISEEAIASAKEINPSLDNTDFKVMDVLLEFPNETFDFISMCEIGYFFNADALINLFNEITEHLSDQGQLLMVHWTSYVKDFPLTGKKVHQIFKELYGTNRQFELIDAFHHDYYELLLWKKNRQKEEI